MGRLPVHLFRCALALQTFVTVLLVRRLFFEQVENNPDDWVPLSLSKFPTRPDTAFLCINKSRYALSAFNRSNSTHCRDYFINVMCNGTAMKPLNIRSECPHRKPPSRPPVILGCYAINTDLLSSFMLSEPRLDTDCVHLCQQSGVRYAFSTASRICGCRQQLPSAGPRLPPSACSSPCLLPVHANTSTQRLQLPLCGKQVAIQVTDTASLPPSHKQPDPLSRSTITTTDVVRPVRIVYLLVWHGRSWYQIQRLFRLIFCTRHYYYIHVDARSNYLYQRVLHLSKRYPHNVYVTEKRWVPIWGGTDLLLMMLSAMHHLIVDMGSKWHWDFLINLSGADLPVRPQNQLIAYLSQQRGKIFLHSNPNRPQFIISQGFDRVFASCDHYMWDLGPRPLPTGFILDGGSDWMILPRAFVEYVAFTRDALFNDLVEYFRYSLLPVEMFFHTLAQNTHFCDSVVTHALRFAHWDRPRGCECKYGSVVDWCGCSPVAFRGLRGEQQLCARVGGCLGYQPSDEPVFFARKFDPTVDLGMVEFVVKTVLGKVPYQSTRQFYLENIYSGELEADSTSSLRLITPAIFETQLRQLVNLVNLSSSITTPSDFHEHLDAFALFNATYQRLSLNEEFPSLRLYPPKLVLRAPVLITAGRVAPYSVILEILLQPPSLLWASELPVSEMQLGDVIYLEVATMFEGKEQLVRNYPRLLTTADPLQLIIMWKGEIAAPGRQARRFSTVTITISSTYSHPACIGHSTLSLGEGKHVLNVFDCPSCFLLVVPLTSVLHNCSITHGLWRVHARASSGQVAQTEFFLFPLAPLSTDLLSSSTWGSLQPSNFCVHSEGASAGILPIFRKWDCSVHEWSTFSDDHEPAIN